LRAHLQAFRQEPISYAQAVLWRLRRLRLRSRQRFAALLGATDVAYDLWLQREEGSFDGEVAHRDALQNVWCVIDIRAGNGDLAATLESIIAAGWQAVLIGGEAEGRLPAIGHVRELAAFARAKGVEWLCVVQPGDQLSPKAPQAYGSMSAGSAAILYADDDLIDERGRRRQPHFKPGWNPELFAHHDYLTGSCLLRVRPADLAELPEGGWVEHLVTHLLRKGTVPVHVPQILHHRRSRPEPRVPTAPLRFVDGRRPSVSVIIPTRDQADLLGNCLNGVRATSYPELEVVVVDNGSEDEDALDLLRQLEAGGAKVLRRPGPFNFSALNNEAVKHSASELLCFLNNDVEMLTPDWLETLAVQAMREDVGAVGARLLYSDGTIQHAGVIIGMGGAAGHAHRGQEADRPGYFERSRLPQQVSAVTAACLVVGRAKFLAVGGFDEEAFPVAFNDVDLCLRLDRKGWKSLYEPRATLVHHESKSRGMDTDPVGKARFLKEMAALQHRWQTDTRRDPYHHPSLSRHSTSFVVEI
jgi:GT2 family glycosyltransferase